MQKCDPFPEILKVMVYVVGNTNIRLKQCLVRHNKTLTITFDLQD